MDKFKNFIKKYKAEILIALTALSSIIASIATMDGINAGICSIVIALIAVLIGVLKNGFTESSINLIAKAIQIIIETLQESKEDHTDQEVVSVKNPMNRKSITLEDIKDKLINDPVENISNKFKKNFVSYGVGVKPSPDDDRDYQLSSLIKRAVKLPDEYIPKVYAPIFNQGDSSECAACSIASYRYIQEYDQSNNREPYSPSFIYANREPGQEYEGMVMRDVLKKIKEDGICNYDDFPGFYLYSKAKRLFDKESTKLKQLAYPNRISSYYRLGTVREIMTAIVMTGAAYVAVDCYDSIFNPQDGYVKYDPKKDIENYGGHALLAVGYKDGYWLIQNSWGKEYGINGYMWLPMDNEIIGITEAWACVDEITERELSE